MLCFGRFQKLPAASNGKFLRCLVVFFSLHMAKHGPDMLLDQLERVQARPARRPPGLSVAARARPHASSSPKHPWESACT